MYELPLFPLNTVLFPGMPLQLHIFEERYKLMIEQCYNQGQPFGVTLIKNGREVGGRAEPFTVGCTAVITEMERLAGGRFNIVAVGTERFQIHGLKPGQPYMVGLVEDLPLTNADPDTLTHGGRILRPWVRRYLEILASASETQFDLQQLPDEPLRLAYLASFLLNIPAAQKQDLLNIGDADQLINELRTFYRREVTLLDAMLSTAQAEDIGTFSSN
ncbi:MAG: LON peptidase substrate-binding domain-containing protein [Anaerolineae bacterium]|nr:LON peptidase substrate-binding domain-containing protein [Anaerolineae bacterium]